MKNGNRTLLYLGVPFLVAPRLYLAAGTVELCTDMIAYNHSFTITNVNLRWVLSISVSKSIPLSV